MTHALVVLHFLALVAGASSISQAMTIWLRQRKAIIRHYCLFLFSMWLILLSLSVTLYGRAASMAGNLTLSAVSGVLQAAGGLLYVVAGPFFYHALLGLRLSRGWLGVYLAIDAIALAAAVGWVAAPEARLFGIVLNSVLFGLIAFGIVLIGIHIGSHPDAALRRALRTFLVLSAVFIPFVWADAASSWIPALAPFAVLQDVPLPSYFLVLNCLSMAFNQQYHNRPAYAEEDRLTPYFLESFGITRRESEIVSMLLRGASGKEIADKLFISPKTAENHIYSIYRKVGAKSRVQLFHLIRANAVEKSPP